MASIKLLRCLPCRNIIRVFLNAVVIELSLPHEDRSVESAALIRHDHHQGGAEADGAANSDRYLWECLCTPPVEDRMGSFVPVNPI